MIIILGVPILRILMVVKADMVIEVVERILPFLQVAFT